MGFTNAGGMAGSHPGFASGASNSANLDLNDFPALGSQGAQVSSSGANNNLFSPYATQAAAGLSNSSMNMGMMGMLSRGAPFTHDEFPALNRAQPAASEPRGAHGVSTSMHPMGTSSSAHPDHAAPVAWQQEQQQQQRQNLVRRHTWLMQAQDLARKHNLHGPQSPSTLSQPAAPSAWMQSYGAQQPAALNRLGMARSTGEGGAGIRMEHPTDAEAKSLEMAAHDVPGHAAFVANNDAVQRPIHQVLASPADRLRAAILDAAAAGAPDPMDAALADRRHPDGIVLDLELADDQGEPIADCLAGHPRLCAVGEFGLDYFIETLDRQRQPARGREGAGRLSPQGARSSRRRPPEAPADHPVGRGRWPVAGRHGVARNASPLIHPQALPSLGKGTSMAVR